MQHSRYHHHPHDIVSCISSHGDGGISSARALVGKIPEHLSIMSRLPNHRGCGWKANEVIKSKVLILLMKTLQEKGHPVDLRALSTPNPGHIRPLHSYANNVSSELSPTRQGLWKSYTPMPPPPW